MRMLTPSLTSYYILRYFSLKYTEWTEPKPNNSSPKIILQLSRKIAVLYLLNLQKACGSTLACRNTIFRYIIR